MPHKTHVVPDNAAQALPAATVSLGSSSSSVVTGSSEREYFDSFKKSFRSRTAASASGTTPAATPAVEASASVQHYTELLRFLMQWERELRDQLVRHEAAEVTQLVHSVEAVLLPLIPALRDVSPLDLVQREQLGRWSIKDDFYQLLLDATELQEMVHRRALCSVEEPQQRKHVEDGEVPHWIETRRLQVMRENQESSSAQSAAQVQRLAYFKHIQQQLYQVFLLEESERADRMEVERLQRLHVGGLAEVISKEYRRVRLLQLRYEAARHPLHPALSQEITAAEGLSRSVLMQEQGHAFRSMQAAEVRDYLVQIH